MRLDHLQGKPHLTYCTNIHAGESWADIRASLATHLPPIKAAVAPDRPFGLGLRLSGMAANALAEAETLAEFKAFLAAAGVYVFTINAFPYGPFHGTRVKEEVYQPDWTTRERLRFTNLAADLLAELLPDDEHGSVSTVPGTFKPLAVASGAVETMAAAFVDHAAHLVALERRTGRHVSLAIEPEPCCFLETIDETVRFFEDHLFARPARSRLKEAAALSEAEAEQALRRHLGVCYDVCHAAVEFEEPLGSLQTLAAAGIAVPKLQLSAALRVPKVGPGTEVLLKPFDEGVYLHQVVQNSNGRLRRFVDLPQALAEAGGAAGSEWRVHFHVPVFLERMTHFDTTQAFLAEILQQHRADPISPHLEVETYTWDVLPESYRSVDLSSAIARELNWVRTQLQQ